MPAYTVNTLTLQGLAKLAGASASTPLIYTRILSSEQSMDATAAISASASDFESIQGTIAAASATGDVARIVGALQNTTASQVTLKSFALCARLDGELTDVVILVLSDPIASAILPPGGGPTSTAAISFSLIIASGSGAMVTVTPAGSATVSDLNRFVSIHKAGDSSSGDDQAILGNKSFSGSTHFMGTCQFESDASFGNLTASCLYSPAVGVTGSQVDYLAASTAYAYESATHKAIVTQAAANASMVLSSTGATTSCVWRVTLAATNVIKSDYDGNAGAYYVQTGVLLKIAAGLSGIAPSYAPEDTAITLPIGGIVAVWLPQGDIGSYAYAGAVLTILASTRKTAKNQNGTFTQGERYVPAGKYVLLMDATYITGDAWALVQRIE